MVKTYKNIAIGTKDVEKGHFEIRKSDLFRIYERNYGLYGDLSEHVYSHYDQQNILSPYDTHSALLKVKMVIQRQEKGIMEEVRVK